MNNMSPRVKVWRLSVERWGWKLTWVEHLTGAWYGVCNLATNHVPHSRRRCSSDRIPTARYNETSQQGQFHNVKKVEMNLQTSDVRVGSELGIMMLIFSSYLYFNIGQPDWGPTLASRSTMRHASNSHRVRLVASSAALQAKCGRRFS